MQTNGMRQRCGIPGDPQPPDSPAGDSAPIDPAAIDRLRELDPDGRQGMLERVLRAYQVTLERHLGDIRTASAAGDADTMMRTAHTLKSSSAAIGAMRFSQRCADVESAIRDGNGMPAAAEVEALIHEGRAVLCAVRAMLTSRSGSGL